MPSKFSFLVLIQFRLVWTKLNLSSSNFIPFISITYKITYKTNITYKTCTFINGDIWNFCLEIFRNWDINARGWQSCIISYDFRIIQIFFLKKFNIVVDLLMIYKLKKKKKLFHYFYISQFYTPTKKRDFSTKKKKSKTKIITNRPTQVYK